MYTVAVVSRKGGAGKTTIAVHLATFAQRQGQRTLLVDADPQASAIGWHNRRDAPGVYPELVPAAAGDVSHILSQARSRFDLTIIDTPPHSDAIAAACAALASLTLIPCRASAFDLDSISATLKLAALTGARPVVLLNAVPPRGSIADEAQADLESRVSVAPVRITQRVAYAHAIIDGRAVMDYEPNGRAAAEVGALYRWIMKTLKGTSHAKKAA